MSSGESSRSDFSRELIYMKIFLLLLMVSLVGLGCGGTTSQPATSSVATTTTMLGATTTSTSLSASSTTLGTGGTSTTTTAGSTATTTITTMTTTTTTTSSTSTTTTTTTSTSTTTTILYTLSITAEGSTFGDEAAPGTPQYSLLTHEAGYDAVLDAERDGFIKFDLSSVPTTAVVYGATLNLYITEVVSAETKIYFYAAAADWDETTLTWQNRPSGAGQPGIPAETFSLQQTGWVSIDADSTVQQWFNGSLDNYGLILMSYNSSSTNIVRYLSGASAINKPYLELVVR